MKQQLRPVLLDCQLLIERTTDWLHLAKNLLGGRKLVDFLVHAETSLVVFSNFRGGQCHLHRDIHHTWPRTCVNSLPNQPGFRFELFCKCISRFLVCFVSLLGHSPHSSKQIAGIEISFLISFLASILSIVLYSLYPVAAGVLGWTGAFVQVAITLLLTQSIEEASKAGNIDSIEIHVH